MYKVLRSVLFLFDPERVHYFSMNSLRLLCRLGPVKKMIKAIYRPKLSAGKTFSAFGLSFSNPVGLGAGFDKNAKYLAELESLGFGFVEIGTVTPRPQDGNEKPRLFRLPDDKALVNRMGFNNDGVELIAERLKIWKEREELRIKNAELSVKDEALKNTKLIIGGNIGKNKITPNEDAWKDYEICFSALHPYVDYFVVNVSSPNTPGLRELQEKDSLRKLLTNLQGLNAAYTIQKPILLKIAPDLTKEQLDDVISLATEIKLDGLVCSNTTISREGLSERSTKKISKIGAGGLSGKPLRQRSTEIVEYVHQQTRGSVPIIASGGIFTAADAEEKMKAGATLIQVWTGFIYEGPGIVKNICKGL